MTTLDAFLAGMAGLQLATHNTMILAKRGLISPDEVDHGIDGVMDTLEGISPELFGDVQKNLDPLFAELKQFAAQNWRGAA